MIHPTAVIDPGARLGEGVEIGPYCVVGRDVTLGDGCTLANHVSLSGPATIGRNNTFFPFCSIGQRSQDLKYDGEPTYLEIGDGNAFREFCTVNRGTARGSRTRVGNGNNFLAYAHVAHDCTVGNHTIFSLDLLCRSVKKTLSLVFSASYHLFSSTIRASFCRCNNRLIRSYP